MTDILVIGATGKIGRHVVDQLGTAARAFVRNPASANLPPGTQVARGDLTEPASLPAVLDNVDAVFLLWPFITADGADEIIETLSRHVRHIVYVSAVAAETGFWGDVEQLIAKSGVEWTFLRPGGFMSNTLMWAHQIRQGQVRWPYGSLARPLIHEADIAAVAVRALTENGHAGRTYELSGPERITQIEQVRIIGTAIGHPVRWEEISPDEGRQQLKAMWGDVSFVDSAMDAWAAMLDEPEAITHTVEEITGRRAHTFGEWAREHAADFS